MFGASLCRPKALPANSAPVSQSQVQAEDEDDQPFARRRVREWGDEKWSVRAIVPDHARLHSVQQREIGKQPPHIDCAQKRRPNGDNWFGTALAEFGQQRRDDQQHQQGGQVRGKFFAIMGPGGVLKDDAGQAAQKLARLAALASDCPVQLQGSDHGKQGDTQREGQAVCGEVDVNISRRAHNADDDSGQHDALMEKAP